MPRFSVVVPAYNASATLAETLDALSSQLFSDWECVVVDDGSTDDTAAIVGRYCARDPRFKLVQQANKRTAEANNTGVRAASGDLLVICAADDFLLPHHLSVMHQFIERNADYDIFSSNGEYLDHETGERSAVYTSEAWQVERELTFEEVLGSCFFSVGAVYRRRTFDAVGGFRPGVYVDDYDFWLRAMASGARQRYIPEVLSVHRASSFQQSANVDRVTESDIEVLNHLIEHDLVSSDRMPAVRRAIANRNAVLDARRREEWETAAGERLAGVRAGLASVVGDRIAGRIIHLGSPIMRALRARKGMPGA